MKVSILLNAEARTMLTESALEPLNLALQRMLGIDSVVKDNARLFMLQSFKQAEGLIRALDIAGWKISRKGNGFWAQRGRMLLVAANTPNDPRLLIKDADPLKDAAAKKAERMQANRLRGAGTSVHRPTSNPLNGLRR